MGVEVFAVFVECGDVVFLDQSLLDELGLTQAVENVLDPHSRLIVSVVHVILREFDLGFPPRD